MAQKVRNFPVEHENRFPAEADGEFEIVKQQEISDWREKLAERFCIGQGRLIVIEDPAA